MISTTYTVRSGRARSEQKSTIGPWARCGMNERLVPRAALLPMNGNATNFAARALSLDRNSNIAIDARFTRNLPTPTPPPPPITSVRQLPPTTRRRRQKLRNKNSPKNQPQNNNKRPSHPQRLMHNSSPSHPANLRRPPDRCRSVPRVDRDRWNTQNPQSLRETTPTQSPSSIGHEQRGARPAPSDTLPVAGATYIARCCTLRPSRTCRTRAPNCNHPRPCRTRS